MHLRGVVVRYPDNSENFVERRDSPIAIVGEQMVTIDEGRPEACGLRASVILER